MICETFKWVIDVRFAVWHLTVVNNNGAIVYMWLCGLFFLLNRPPKTPFLSFFSLVPPTDNSDSPEDLKKNVHKLVIHKNVYDKTKHFVWVWAWTAVLLVDDFKYYLRALAVKQVFDPMLESLHYQLRTLVECYFRCFHHKL